jgi:hypothetical protein
MNTQHAQTLMHMQRNQQLPGQAPAPDPTEGHTPGPWEVEKLRDGYGYAVVTEAGGCYIAPHIGVGSGSYDSTSAAEDTERSANAALIALAPVLKAENEKLRAALQAVAEFANAPIGGAFPDNTLDGRLSKIYEMALANITK